MADSRSWSTPERAVRFNDSIVNDSIALSIRISVLGSGSGGNATLVATERTRVLVDAGLSRRETFRRLKSIGESPESLDAILISHEHTDHIAGMLSLAGTLDIPVYLTALTQRAISLAPDGTLPPRRAAAVPTERQGRPGLEGDDAGEVAQAFTDHPRPAEDGRAGQARMPASPFELEKPPRPPRFEIFRSGQRFAVGDLEIEPFTVPHDAADPVAFCVSANGVRVGVCIDLGYLPDSVKVHLRGCQCLVLESNHDLDMLKVGPYPWSVKQRVMSRTGHLSNDAVAEFLERDYHPAAPDPVLVLAHLSENNNHPEIARLSATMALDAPGARGSHGTRLVLSSQKSPTEVFHFEQEAKARSQNF